MNTVEIYELNDTGSIILIEDCKVAIKKKDQVRGLREKKTLGFMEGMIFVFDREEIHIMNMRNMKLRLWMVWLDKDFNVVDCCMAVPGDKLYFSPSNAKYCLEGHSRLEQWISKGDKLFWRDRSAEKS